MRWDGIELNRAEYIGQINEFFSAMWDVLEL